MVAEDASALRRERRVLDSAVLISGAEQVIDFVLPLFAGAALGLSAGQTGVLIAVSELMAFLIRPFAGLVVDRADRLIVAAGGAGGFALGCGLYALSDGFLLALIAAVVTGTAGSFLWVAIRAIIGERLLEDSSVFAKLVAAEETGGWLILVPAIVLLSAAGYRWVFAGITVCCLVAAESLVSTRRRRSTGFGANPARSELSDKSLGGLGTRLWPMLLAVVVTMIAEAAISLLLILHLQRGFHLAIMEIASVFLPGAIAMSILPTYLHCLVVRFGRRTMLMLGSVMSALFAAGLAFAPNPSWIAALWVLSAVAWSTVIPVQQSVIAEAVGQEHLGHGLSLYEAACLAGAFFGSLAAGLLYESASWLLTCITCAVIIASGAALVPAAVKRLGVTNHPSPTSHPGRLTPRPGTRSSSVGRASETPEPAPTAEENEAEPRPQKTCRELLIDLAMHGGLFLAALFIAWVTIPDLSLRSIFGFGSEKPQVLQSARRIFDGHVNAVIVATIALRVWFVVYVIDLIWTAWKVLERHNDTREKAHD